MSQTAAVPEHDELVPDSKVIRELGITAMSLWRWDRDATRSLRMAAADPHSEQEISQPART